MKLMDFWWKEIWKGVCWTAAFLITFPRDKDTPQSWKIHLCNVAIPLIGGLMYIPYIPTIWFNLYIIYLQSLQTIWRLSTLEFTRATQNDHKRSPNNDTLYITGDLMVFQDTTIWITSDILKKMPWITGELKRNVTSFKIASLCKLSFAASYPHPPRMTSKIIHQQSWKSKDTPTNAIPPRNKGPC